MAIGSSSHITPYKGGSLVASRNDSPPLLPYERQLIQALGISEQDYRQRLRELYAVAHRSAGYEHIPDIQNVPIAPLLVNLAIGLVLTGVSVLLSPKQQQSTRERREVTQQELPNETGRSRFNQTKGFQGAPALATMGARVPYIFGKTGTIPSIEGDIETAKTGGIVAEPVLVWSRMESRNSYQTFKLLMCIGLGQMEEVLDPNNVMLSGQSISSYFQTNVLLHHRRYGGTIDKGDKIYGYQDVAGEGYESLPYGAPSGETLDKIDHAFCQCFSAPNSNKFGVYQPIRNGNRYSVNWEVISIPSRDGDDDPGEQLKTKRRKVAGDKADSADEGMPGVGRWYNCLHGVRSANIDGKNYAGTYEEKRVEIGDILFYKINKYAYDDHSDIGLNSDGKDTCPIGDIESDINTLRQEADNALQEGQVLLMNDVLLQVIERPADVWTPDNTFEYKLRVVDFVGTDRKVGIYGKEYLDTGGKYWELILHDGDDNTVKGRGTRWYTLMKANFALANNTRACDVTEIGIRSQVYSQANGLCNFPAVPSPSQLKDYDEDGVQLSTPVQSKYMYRTSFFHIFVRRLSKQFNNDSVLDGYEQLEPIFAISGNEPIDIFNWIRIVHPSRNSYSFKLVPITSQTIGRESRTIYSLDTRGEMRTVQAKTSEGSFQFYFPALIQSADELFNLPEMRQDHKSFDRIDVRYSAASYVPVNTGSPEKNWAINQGFFEAMLGHLKPTSRNPTRTVAGTTRNTEFTATLEVAEGTVTAEIGVLSSVITHGSASTFGTNKKWQVGGATFTLLSIDLPPGYNRTGDIIVSRKINNLRDKSYHLSGEAPGGWSQGSYEYKFRISGGRVVNVSTGKYDRQFDSFARIKEATTYTQMSNSCSGDSEHTIAYVNEVLTNAQKPTYQDMDMVGLQMKAINSDISVSQISVYKREGIIVERLDKGNRPAKEAEFTASANFANILHWLLTHRQFGIGKDTNSVYTDVSGSRYGYFRSPLIDIDSFVTTAKFLEKQPFRYDGAISAEVNLREWGVATAQLFMCNLAMRNGRFCLLPGVPTDSKGNVQKNVTIKALFTSGNILEGSFEMEYLPLTDRRNYEAVVKYRLMTPDTLASERTVLVRYAANDKNNLPQEDLDLTEFATSYDHAVMIARYQLSLRKRVDHIIKFETIPQGLQVAPGDYIKVQTDLNPYTDVRSGSIDSEGKIMSIHQIDDGNHEISVYLPNAEGVQQRTMTVKNGIVEEVELFGSLFALPNLQNTFGVYMVEEVSIEESGTVSITGSHHPTTGGEGNDLGSKIVQDIQTDSRWTVKTA